MLDLNPEPSQHFSIATDVADDESVRASISAVVAKYGQIDIVVNNAGIGAHGNVAANSDEEWHRVWIINVLGIGWCLARR